MIDVWEDDSVQFPRLLAEISAIDLSKEQILELCKSMDLKPGDIRDLLDRAQRRWELIKYGTISVLGENGDDEE